MPRTPTILLLAVLLDLAATLPARADAVLCQRAIAKESAKHVQATMKALQRCEDRKTAGALALSTDCAAESGTAKLLAKADTRLRARVVQRCGGLDRTCGTPDDDALASIGWGSACPGFEDSSCTAAIADCSGVATCLACVGRAAVAQAVDLYYDALATSEFGSGSALNRCQRAIGAETARFFSARSKALQRCRDGRLKGRHTNDCPTPGDGKATAAIAKAEARKVSRICAACGGANAACGGGDDPAPADIGFVSSCPAVTVPDGPSCAGAVGTVGDIVGCVDCVTEFKGDCLDALAVPGLTSYPPECGPTTTTTTTATTTSTTTTTAGGSSCPPPPLVPLGTLTFTMGEATDPCSAPPFTGRVDDLAGNPRIDLGLGCLYVGGGAAALIPPVRLPDGGRSVLAVAGLSGLGGVSVTGSPGTGPADCTLGAGPGRHCINGKPGIDGQGTCSSDADCDGRTGACDSDANCFFGAPVPVPIAGLSVCIMNAVAGDVCGTANLLTNTTSVSANLSSRIYLTGDGISPCPQCVAGSCTAGARHGLPCSGGVGSANTTIECPPRPTQFFGRLDVNLSTLSTGSSTLAHPAGMFCPGQPTPGAFAGEASLVVETGAPLLSGGGLFDTTLAGTFCVPATGNETFDAIADLPGPGAVSVPGTIEVNLLP
jgi:hypothetical protein